MPFADYKDFDDCVRKNSDKDDPKAYCGKIKAAAEGESMNKSFQVRTTTTSMAVLDSFEETDDGRMYARLRLLRSGTSKNRRTYPPHVVKEAVDKKLFDGVLMFTKHDKKRPEAEDRGFHEMVSAIESTSWDEDQKAMNGRVEFFDRPFYDKAQRAKDYIGVSINALVRGTRRIVGGQVFEDVEGWQRPRSVDWVFNPAAGGAILAFEDEDEEVAIDWSKITPEELKKNAPEVYEAIEAEKTGDPEEDPKEPVKSKKTETGDEKAMVAREDVEEMVKQAIKADREAEEAKRTKRETAAASVRAAFEKSGLHPKVRARVMAGFEGVEEYDEKAVTEAIEAAKEELKAVGAGPHISGMGPSGGGSDGDKGEKVFSVHESVKAQLLGPAKKKQEADDKKKEE